jgi:hypothetical protein
VSTSADRHHLDRLTLQFELLRTKLLRTARALISTEEQRSSLLQAMASRCHPSASPGLVQEARQAQANRDLLAAFTAQLRPSSAAAGGSAVRREHADVTGSALLPEPHVRVVFAVLLFRDGVLSRDEFDEEVRRAFGDDNGGQIAQIIVAGLDGAAMPSTPAAPGT